MAIRVARREGAAHCPYCHDDVPEGPACPSCGVRYHDECAATFGRCAILGCRAPLEVAAPEVTPLPRLVAMASRLFALRPGAAPLDDDASHVVVLLPGSASPPPDAAAAVGELLGHTAYDGRLRLLSPVPEPLVRTRGGADAEAVAVRLAGHGVRALALAARDLLRPLARVDALEVEAGDPPRVVDPISGPVPLARRRLVLSANLLEVHQREEVKNLWATGRKLKSSKPVSRRVSDRQTEPAALVYGEGEVDPVLLRRGVTRLRGSTDPTAFGRWAALLAEVTRGADVHKLDGAAGAALLSRRRPFEPPVEENLPGLLLAGRILHLSWPTA